MLPRAVRQPTALRFFFLLLLISPSPLLPFSLFFFFLPGRKTNREKGRRGDQRRPEKGRQKKTCLLRRREGCQGALVGPLTRTSASSSLPPSDLRVSAVRFLLARKGTNRGGAENAEIGGGP